jgi:mRNA interferase RelE/StbE
LGYWIEFDPRAEKELEKLDREVARRILRFLRERVAVRDDPRSIGEALRGQELGRFWKYRVGEYRLICPIQDRRITVLVLRVGHRRDIYR